MLKSELSLSIDSCHSSNLLVDILSEKITNEFKREMDKQNDFTFSFSKPFKPDNTIVTMENNIL